MVILEIDFFEVRKFAKYWLSGNIKTSLGNVAVQNPNSKVSPKLGYSEFQILQSTTNYDMTLSSHTLPFCVEGVS